MTMFISNVSHSFPHSHKLLALLFGSFCIFSTAMAQETVPVPESIREMVSTSAEGLTEEFALSGRLIRLQGRFRSLATATQDKSGMPVVKNPRTFYKHPITE